MQFNLICETVASGFTVTVALTFPISLPPPVLSLRSLHILIQKCHCKRDNQCKPDNLTSLPSADLKVTAYSRVRYMQNYKEPQAAAAGDRTLV